MNAKEDYLREDLPNRAKTFVLWNNKGGVGKSTLTFNIVCEYAYQFPDRKFLVLDMCPQANSSAFFFGGAGLFSALFSYSLQAYWLNFS
jgi:cellulose biosynthesis protein BcsQ